MLSNYLCIIKCYTYISIFLIYIDLWGLLCFQSIFIIIVSAKVSHFHQKCSLSLWIPWYSKFKILSTEKEKHMKDTSLTFTVNSISVNFLLTYPLHFFRQVATLSHISTRGGWKNLEVPTISMKWGTLSSAVQNEKIILAAEKTYSSIILCHLHVKAFWFLAQVKQRKSGRLSL